MLFHEKIRALICYAGSAPEASTGSKPIGSELDRHIGMAALTSQEFSTRKRDAAPRRHQFNQSHIAVFIDLFFSPQSSVMLR